MNIKTFGQRVAAWASWPINKTASTIGKYGCTTAVYGVALGYYLGKEMNPKDTEIFIRSNNAYTDDLVDWRFLPYFRLRFYCEATPAPIEQLKNEIRAGKLVLLSVDLVGNDDNPDHWVLLLDENFTIFDPWFDEIAPITKRYGKPEREIFGGAYFNWPISNQPTPMPIEVIKGKAFEPMRVKGESTVSVRLELPSPEVAAAIGVDLSKTRDVEAIPGILVTSANDLYNWGTQVERERNQALGERDAYQAEAIKNAQRAGELEVALRKAVDENHTAMEAVKVEAAEKVRVAEENLERANEELEECKQSHPPVVELPTEPTPAPEPIPEPTPEPEVPEKKSPLVILIEWIISLISRKR